MRFHILGFIAVVAFAVGCSHSPKKEIERAAQGYLDAMGNYLIDDATPYASRNTRTFVLPFYKKIMTQCDTAYINSNRPADITINSSRMLSDSTALVYYHKHTPIKDVDDSVMLVLEEDQWLVFVDIEIPTLLLLDSTNIRPRFKGMPHAPRHNLRRIADSSSVN